MSSKKKKQIKGSLASKQYILAPTETDAGVLWLNSLTEDHFRDDVLEHLFRQMEKKGILAWYKNIHGRNDKGVDYLVVSNSEWGQHRVMGIQAKSKPVTRTGSSSSLSGLQIKQECEAAMRHEFDVQKNKARLDNIELWCSAHITEDAEKEFNAAGDGVKVQIMPANRIFTLIEKHCPELLRKIPHCALTVYVRDKSNPTPSKIKLLGCEMHPRKHFLEPLFSKNAQGSSSNVSTQSSVIRKKSESVKLSEIIFSNEHALILAPELSGKTYLLEHVQCLIAEAQCIPIFLSKASLDDLKISAVNHVIAKQLGFYSAGDIERLTENVRIFLLVDDIDRLSEDVRRLVLTLDAKRLKVLATARRAPASAHLPNAFHMTGVNLGSMVRFLRALDGNLGEDKSFTDRAHSFIERSLATSGLPSTPFTIAMMLGECQNSTRKFSTPTMGRLIERFVEMQLGSHSDNLNRVDFETKSDLLRKFGGHVESEFTLADYKRQIAKFIDARSHPHTVDDFIEDLSRSGVFQFDNGIVKWAHPVIKEYYWVRNLIMKDKTGPILKRLSDAPDNTLAALAGSQMKDAGKTIDSLSVHLKRIKLPPTDKMIEIVNESSLFSFLTSDEDEDEWLDSLEKDGSAVAAENKARHPIAELAERSFRQDSAQSNDQTVSAPKLDDATRTALRKKLEPLVTQFAEAKLHVAFNLAALLVNARATKTVKKLEAVKHILSATQFLGNWFQELIETFFSDKSKIHTDMVGARMFAEMEITDRMIGDPFLVSIFKRLLPQAKTDEEKLLILDLLLCCGEDDYEIIIAKLKEIQRPQLIVPFYLRVAVLYFFRFHRYKDREALRKLLKAIRTDCKGLSLKPIAV